MQRSVASVPPGQRRPHLHRFKLRPVDVHIVEPEDGMTPPDKVALQCMQFLPIRVHVRRSGAVLQRPRQRSAGSLAR